MKKPLSHTKVTVKLRKSQYKEEWYLIVEAYPVIGTGGKVERVVESVNRSITTPVWDKTSSTRGAKFKPKRDINGIIQCRTAIDQESCVYADNVRKLRQHEYDNQALYTDKESEIAAQNERSEQDFIAYFKKITYTRHPNASKSIIVNWERVAVLLELFTDGKPMPFNTITVKLLEELKVFTATEAAGKALETVGIRLLDHLIGSLALSAKVHGISAGKLICIQKRSKLSCKECVIISFLNISRNGDVIAHVESVDLVLSVFFYDSGITAQRLITGYGIAVFILIVNPEGVIQDIFRIEGFEIRYDLHIEGLSRNGDAGDNG